MSENAKMAAEKILTENLTKGRGYDQAGSGKGL